MLIPKRQRLVSEILIKYWREFVIIFADRKGLSPDTIYYGVMEALESANCNMYYHNNYYCAISFGILGLVADVTYPSLGVGYEISYAQNKGYKVLCLFHKTPGRGT